MGGGFGEEFGGVKSEVPYFFFGVRETKQRGVVGLLLMMVDASTNGRFFTLPENLVYPFFKMQLDCWFWG